MLENSGHRIAECGRPADFQVRIAFAYVGKTLDLAHVNDGVEFAVLLRHPQADIRTARQYRGVRVPVECGGQLVDRPWRKETALAVTQFERAVADDLPQAFDTIGHGFIAAVWLPQPVVIGGGNLVHRTRCGDDRAIAGAAAQIARERVVDIPARGIALRLVKREQRHDETRRAEAALRAVLLDHGLLHRVQPGAAPVETLHGNQLLAVQRRQELDAGIHGFERELVASAAKFGEHHGARAAIAFRATLFRSRPTQVLAQELQHRACRVDVVQLHDLTVEHETDFPARRCVA